MRITKTFIKKFAKQMLTGVMTMLLMATSAGMITATAEEYETYYSLKVGNVSMDATDSDVAVPVYFDSVKDARYTLGVIEFKIVIPNGFDFDGSQVNRKTLGYDLNANVTATSEFVDEITGERYINVGITFPGARLTNETTSGGEIVEFYFVPNDDLVDNKKYALNFESRKVGVLDPETDLEVPGVYVHSNITDGSITVGTPSLSSGVDSDPTGTYELTIGGTAYNANYNDKVTLTASATQSGKVFSHWTKDGHVVSYDKEYVFHAMSDATIEAVYAESAPTAKACYTVNYTVVDDEIEFIMECTFPEGVSDGTMTLAPYGTKADGTAKDSASFTANGLSGTAQYKFSFKGISNFDANKYQKLGLVFGGTYDSNSVTIDVLFTESSESGVYVLEGFPDVEAGVVGKTF